MIKPKALKKGDKVAIIAPASPPKIGKEDQLLKAKKGFEQLGLEPVLLAGCFEKYGYLSGSDKRRADDFNEAFSNNEYKGVLCMSGGYGTPRMINDIDFDNVKKNPKIFLGYSDITAIHNAIHMLCGMVTYHGPMGRCKFFQNDLNDDKFTKESVEKALFSNEVVGELINPIDQPLDTIIPGKTNGQLVGGNLNLIADMIGTPYELDTKGKIIFIEDVNEEPEIIDRWLNCLDLSGKFNDCNGVIIGTFSGCQAKSPKDSLTLMQIFKDIIGKYNKPVINNMRSGHVFPQLTLPFGVEVILDATNKKVTVLENSNI